MYTRDREQDNQVVELEAPSSKEDAIKIALILLVVGAAGFADYKVYKKVCGKTGMNNHVLMYPVNQFSAVLKLFKKQERTQGLTYLGYVFSRNLYCRGVSMILRMIAGN